MAQRVLGHADRQGRIWILCVTLISGVFEAVAMGEEMPQQHIGAVVSVKGGWDGSGQQAKPAASLTIRAVRLLL